VVFVSIVSVVLSVSVSISERNEGEGSSMADLGGGGLIRPLGRFREKIRRGKLGIRQGWAIEVGRQSQRSCNFSSLVNWRDRQRAWRDTGIRYFGKRYFGNQYFGKLYFGDHDFASL
jgi:hypothetical protein